MSNSYYDKNEMKKMADTIENYLYFYDMFVIKDGIDRDEYEEAKKKIKKLIKHLRNGDGDKVFDQERYAEYLERMGRIN